MESCRHRKSTKRKVKKLYQIIFKYYLKVSLTWADQTTQLLTSKDWIDNGEKKIAGDELLKQRAELCSIIIRRVHLTFLLLLLQCCQGVGYQKILMEDFFLLLMQCVCEARVKTFLRKLSLN